jgi:hypothetical protein
MSLRTDDDNVSVRKPVLLEDTELSANGGAPCFPCHGDYYG